MTPSCHNHAHRRSLWKGPALTTALLLPFPILGNHFVEGWNWPLPGFILVGTILFGLGLAYQLATRRMDSLAYRAAVAIALATALLVVWGNFVQAADDVNPAAMLFLTVPLVGLIGAALARFRPAGMTRAMFAVALAQGLVFVIVLSRNPPVTSWSAAVWRGFGGNAVSLMLFISSALLFRKAARAELTPDAI